MERTLAEIKQSSAHPSSTDSCYLQGNLHHRGFTVQVPKISPKQLSDVEQALAQQIDIVADIKVGPSISEFFRRVPITMNTDLGLRLGDYSPQTGVTLNIALQHDPNMPVLLHELIHAFHHECLPMGYDNPDVLRFYHRDWFRIRPHQCWAKNKKARFFAMTATGYLYGGGRTFYDRENLIRRQPPYYMWLQELFGA